MNYLLICKIAQVVISLLAVLFVILQPKGTGFTSGVGNAFGGYRSRRGMERLIFTLTIFSLVFLIVNSLLIVILSS